MKKIRWVVEKKDQNDHIYIFRTLDGISKYFHLNISIGNLLYQNNIFDSQIFNIKKVGVEHIEDFKHTYPNKHIMFVREEKLI